MQFVSLTCLIIQIISPKSLPFLKWKIIIIFVIIEIFHFPLKAKKIHSKSNLFAEINSYLMICLFRIDCFVKKMIFMLFYSKNTEIRLYNWNRVFILENCLYVNYFWRKFSFFTLTLYKKLIWQFLTIYWIKKIIIEIHISLFFL